MLVGTQGLVNMPVDTWGLVIIPVDTQGLVTLIIVIVIFRLYLFYYGCLVCMHVYHIHAWCLRRSELGIGSPGTGVLDGCELPHG